MNLLPPYGRTCVTIANISQRHRVRILYLKFGLLDTWIFDLNMWGKRWSLLTRLWREKYTYNKCIPNLAFGNNNYISWLLRVYHLHSSICDFLLFLFVQINRIFIVIIIVLFFYDCAWYSHRNFRATDVFIFRCRRLGLLFHIRVIALGRSDQSIELSNSIVYRSSG